MALKQFELKQGNKYTTPSDLKLRITVLTVSYNILNDKTDIYISGYLSTKEKSYPSIGFVGFKNFKKAYYMSKEEFEDRINKNEKEDLLYESVSFDKVKLDKLNRIYKYGDISVYADNDIELYYPKLEIEFYYNRQDVDVYDEFRGSIEYTYKVDIDEIISTLEDLPEIIKLQNELDEDAYIDYLDAHLQELCNKYKGYILDYFEEKAIDEASREYEPDDDWWDD